MELKKEIRAAIEEQLERRKNAEKKVEKRNVVLGNIRTALVQIDNVCKVITEIGGPSVTSRLPSCPIYIGRVPEQPEHNCKSVKCDVKIVFKRNINCSDGNY